ncbi:MAG: Hsp20/alpha crystallin family protein [Cyanobacteria bacterium P01_G01_bin.38]
MALVQWEPWREMETLRRQMSSLLEEIGMLNGPLPNERHNWIPAIEISSSEDALMLKAQIPGIRPEDLDVQVSRNGVLIAGQYRREDKDQQLHSEFRYGHFRRAIPLNTDVKNTEVDAQFKDGVLTLKMPKADHERNRVHRIRLGQSDSSENVRVESSNTQELAGAAINN